MGSLEGQTLGQYRVLTQMGQGGMATVFKAYHPRLDRYVAVKVLHQAFLEDSNFLARFEREAQIVARLEHPHIVPVFDFDELNGRPYLVMKYIEGRTLKNLLSERSLALGEIMRIMSPIADALDYAHRQGVLHRDIKPSNIIIDVNGTPYLTDFGLARMAQLGESTLSHDMLLGTPHYISPEQAMGSRDLDNRTDIYSLGVILYELVVGRVPFSADTPFAIIHDHIYRPLPSPSEVNPQITPEVSAVLEKALAKAPADRYASANDLLNAFQAAAANSHLTTLDPDRAEAADVSLAQMRRAQDQGGGTEVISNVGKPKREFAPPVPPLPPAAPSIPAPTPRKMVVDAEFDFADAERAIEKVGAAIGGALENAFDSWSSKNTDFELRPYEDENALRRRIEARFKKRGEFIGHLVAYVIVNLILWFGFRAFNFGSISEDTHFLEWMAFPWPIIVSLGWGAGLAAHMFETYFQTGARDERRYQAIRGEFRRLYGDDWSGVDKRELKKVRRRVEKPFKARAEFFEHAAVYILINVMLWMIYLFGSGVPDIGEFITAVPWPAFVTLGWGIGLAVNFVEMLTVTGRERAIQRAVERAYLEKPKNDFSGDADESDSRRSRRGRARRVRLTGDGELTDSMIAEWSDDDEKPKRSRS